MPPIIDVQRQNRTEQFNVNLGDNLKHWRIQAGVTQAWVAELADMSSSQLARIEAGERTISLKQALVICHLLGIEIIDLITTEEEE